MKKLKLNQEIVKELLDYNPLTGVFIWKERDVKWFNDTKGRKAVFTAKIWNTRYANKIAFSSKDKDGYCSTAILAVTCKAHQIAWLYVYGKWPDGVIDHINGIPYDNRIENLRDVAKLENDLNQAIAKNNVSGTIGVSFWSSATGPKKWVASISHGGKKLHLGYFLTKEEATLVRKQAEIYYGYHENHGTRYRK